MIWKDFMYFTTAERNGIKVMLLLLLIVLFAPAAYKWVFPPSDKGLGSFERQVMEFEKKLADMSAPSASGGNFEKPDNAEGATALIPVIKPFHFNPNNLPESSWKQMGLPRYLIRTIKNYESAGGSFRFKEDLLRIYLMKEEWYEALEPYIDLLSRGIHPRSTAQTQDAREASKKVTPRAEEAVDEPLAMAEATRMRRTSVERSSHLLIDINKADTLGLIQLRGIGSVFSRRIIAYRELLGGFLNAEQLLEVYGMDTARLNPIRENLHFDQQVIERINLNEADFATLVRHPYIDRNLANALLSFMNQHKPLDSLEELRRSHLITDDLFERISPYLKIK